MFRRRFEGGFRRDGFRAGCWDTWHSPKDGPEGVSTEASKGLSAGLRGHVSYSERAPKGSSGLVGSKGFPEGGGSFGEVFIIGLGINGWDSFG